MLKTLDRPRRKAANLHVEYVVVVPEMAKQWMERNTSNRSVARHVVAKYARDMAAKRWQVTGDAIRFDTNNRLLDGQHRLLACIQADTPFETAVIYNLPPETQTVIDGGKSRNAADILSMSGLRNVTATASALKLIVDERDQGTRARMRSTSEVVECLARHPELPLYVPQPGTLVRTLSCSEIGALSYIASKLTGEPATAQAMVEVMKTGVPSYHGDMVHAYRERLLGIRDGVKRIQKDARWNTFKYCWNLFREQKTVAQLRWQKEFVPIKGLDPKRL